LDHPIILVIAVLAALVALPYVARTFFSNRDQFIEDIGAADRSERPRLVVDLVWLFSFFPCRGIWLNILWFLIVVVLVVGVIYQVLMRLIEAFA